MHESGNYKWLEITGRALIMSLTTDNAYHIIDGIPFDADVVSRGYDPARDEFYMLLEHDSYDFIPEGEDIPRAEVTIESVDNRDIFED